MKYLGTVEIKPNRSPDIDRWNRFVKNALGSSYCAAYVSYMRAAGSASEPDVITGLARNFWWKSPKFIRHSVGDVLKGAYKPKEGDIVIWQRGTTIHGHVGFVLWWNKDHGRTIEANISPTDAGSQDNGEGVYEKNRKIYLYAYFRIMGFVEVRYD